MVKLAKLLIVHRTIPEHWRLTTVEPGKSACVGTEIYENVVLVVELLHEVMFDEEDVVKCREEVRLNPSSHYNVVAVEVDVMLEPFVKRISYFCRRRYCRIWNDLQLKVVVSQRGAATISLPLLVSIPIENHRADLHQAGHSHVQDQSCHQS